MFFRPGENDHPVPVAVVPGEFTVPGRWSCIVCSTQAQPGVLLRITVHQGEIE